MNLPSIDDWPTEWRTIYLHDGLHASNEGNAEETCDSKERGSSTPEDLDQGLLRQDDDAVRVCVLELGESCNAGEEYSKSPVAGLFSTGPPDGSPADQPTAASPLIATSDDPMDWTVDDVVRELCGKPTLSLPHFDMAVLAETLKRQGVNGSILLCDINAASIREDLEIRNLGQIHALRRLIDRLRQWSEGYRSSAAYALAHDIPPEYAIARCKAFERKRKRLRGEKCPEYDDAIDETERIQQLEAELREARSALASQLSEPLDGANPSKAHRLSPITEGSAVASELRELRSVILAQSEAIVQLQRDISCQKDMKKPQ